MDLTQEDQSTGAAPAHLVDRQLGSLWRQSSHYLAGLGASACLGFVSFPIFTRVFSVADYGSIDLIQKVLLISVALSKLGLQHAALRFYDHKAFSSDSCSARRYYSTILFGTAGWSTAVALVFVAAVLAGSGWLPHNALIPVLLLVSPLIAIRAVQSVVWAFIRVEERTKLYSSVMVAAKVATIAGVCALLPWLGRAPGTYFLGLLAVEVAFLAALVQMFTRRGVFHRAAFDTPLFVSAIKFGLPLIWYEASFIILTSADRFLVRYYLGAEALGLYSVAHGLSQQLNELLMGPINLALVPIYLKLWTTEGRTATISFLRTGLDVFLLGAFGIVTVVALCATDAVSVLASSKYSAAGGLIPIMVGGLLIFTTHVFLNAGLYIQNRTLVIAKYLLYSSALNIGLNLLLMPRIGLWSGAISSAVACTVCTVLMARESFHLLPVSVDRNALARYVVASVLVVLAVSRVHVEPRLLNLCLRAFLAAGLYMTFLLLIDSRIRRFALARLRFLKSPTALGGPSL